MIVYLLLLLTLFLY